MAQQQRQQDINRPAKVEMTGICTSEERPGSPLVGECEAAHGCSTLLHFHALPDTACTMHTVHCLVVQVVSVCRYHAAASMVLDTFAACVSPVCHAIMHFSGERAPGCCAQACSGMADHLAPQCKLHTCSAVPPGLSTH